MNLKIKWLSMSLVVFFPFYCTHSQVLDGEALFQQNCAFCHLTSDSAIEGARAPTREVLSARAPETILRALLDGGAMRTQGYNLSGDQRRKIAETITGTPLGSRVTDESVGRCEQDNSEQYKTLTDPFAGPLWNGWGRDPSNSHSQSAENARLSAAQVPNLELSWAFGFKDASSAWSQPTVASGRIYIGSQDGRVFSLDAKSGCTHWAFVAESGVRSSVSIVKLEGVKGAKYAAIFGDMTGNAYAINAETGAPLWRNEVDSHPLARITGSPVVEDGVVYVTMSSFEESQGQFEAYACCTFRGSVTALSASTGDVLWKTFIVDEPKLRGKKANEMALYGPAGGAIWSAATVDSKRHRIYVAVGNAYAEPQPETTDAILALDMTSGEIIWVRQTTPNDVYTTGCSRGGNCVVEGEVGEDLDYGTSPILATLESGRDLIIVGQKSGMAYALDPDNNGEIVWEYRAGVGGVLGGIEWGTAVDNKNAYIPVSDITLPAPGGLHAVDLASGKRVWYTPPAPPLCGQKSRGCNAAQAAAISLIPGVVFSGAVDGGFRAYSSITGEVIWQYDTNQQFATVNGVIANGASMIGPGPVIVDGMVYVNSGYGSMGGRDGNVLLAFAIKKP